MERSVDQGDGVRLLIEPGFAAGCKRRIDPGRVFLVAPAEGKADKAGVIMELALQ